MTLRERRRTADRALFRRSGALRPSHADPVLRDLGRAANHSVLWIGCAAVCGAAGGRARRGAVRGLLSVAAASALANGVLKPLMPRRRPPARTAPHLARRIVPTPRSSSFPSGHAASAAAFATGVALESPVAGAALAPLAAAVAYSRVHTGVHWPSDVLVGAAVGAAVALSTRRWWAVRDDEPAAVRTEVAAPALRGGDGLMLVVNPGAGSSEEIVEQLRRGLPDARYVTLDTDADTDLSTQLDDLVTADRPTAIGVCGGDGTVATVAAAARTHRLPLAVFPGGTLNHFARDLGAADIDATMRAVTDGYATAVGLGEVTVTGAGGTDARVFVNTASIGGYPDAVRLRERWEPRIGKWPAAGLAMIDVLRTAEPMRGALGGVPTAWWLLFVGNGRYTPRDQVPMSRAALDSGTLDVRYLCADRRWSRVRLLYAAATGTLGASSVYRQYDSVTLSVRVDGPAVALAVDGEAPVDGTVFDFRALPSAMLVYRPPVDQSVP
ncbi:bifunctional phosphatase PAP2/diacylglycerol kinase family protein [Rhodococcus sp. NPDC060084]|uniref:bifunctional phosphatase PAP2/diacylglycerol kinase family protein n=1 Tax=Rhodococcus sp. NPDC060084 TaxID=3347053 RepID=UPI003662DA66